ncbi:MAG TPA: hypothetical protein VKU02_12400 [Gemmataceae bacterium]|nr:hypothetical protein [Gemmataceae bacterium]
MGRRILNCGLTLVLAAGITLLPGCFGVSQNPSYFPHLLPTGDIIRTHAKPPGPSYFSNFDPHAARLEVRPLESTNPVRTQHVLVATIYDEKGNPRRNRRIEWMVEGVGNIVEVDESGVFPGRGYKVDNKYAVSYTDYCEHRITRGNADPNDDFVIRPGQTWCVVSSAVEGDTHVTVYAPEIANWDLHKVFVTKHWVDAEWTLPPPAVNRAGTEHPVTSHIFRHTDRQPLANYRVRYRLLDGPPAVFMPGRAQEAVATSDLSGNATASLVQVTPQPGVNRISVEIIRPPDPSSPSGVGIIIGRGETSKEWQAAQVALTVAAPPTAGVNQELPLTLSVTNNGQVETQAFTVRATLPDGVQFVRSTPRAAVEGNQLIWTFGLLPGGRTESVQLVLRPTRVGPITNCAAVTTVEGLRDEKCVTTQVTPPQVAQLNVAVSPPPAASVGVPISLQIMVSNPGTAPVNNVLLSASFDAGLEHETHANPIELPVGQLRPGESKTVPLVLTARREGRLMVRITATADGNLKSNAEAAVVVQAARLSFTKTGPKLRYVDQPVTWEIRLVNSGDVPLNNVVVRDPLPAEVAFTGATELGQLINGQVVWNVGTVPPGGQKAVQVTARCAQRTQHLVNTAVVTADPGVQEQAQAELEILGLPAYSLEVRKIGDPVTVGSKMTYQISVTNTGTLPGTGVEVTVRVPAEMQITNTSGPTQARVDGQNVLFPALDALPPKQTATFTIEVLALRPGDVRLQAELRSTTLREPVIKQESTNIVVPNGPARP